MRKIVLLSIMTLIVLAGVIGAASPATAQVTSFSAMLSGGGEVPPVPTMAMGNATFTLSPDGQSISYTLSVSNIEDVTAAHIHLAPAGVNGPVIVPLFMGPKPGAFSGVLAQGIITSADLKGSLLGMPLTSLVTEMRAGNTYVNVHTTVNPAGAIRGQIQ